MNICFFGIYNPEYSRNRVLVSGFKEDGHSVVECRVDPKEHSGSKKFWYLFKKYHSIKNISFDVVIVAFPGHSIMWFAYLLFGRKIIFDAFVSLYNSEVEDRKNISAISFKAVYYWILDWISCTLAKKVLLDTNTHIEYFARKYHISKDKFIRVLVSTTPKDFYPLPQVKKENFIVHFHGHFTPLHGVGHIIEAANILKGHKNIKFRIIGGGVDEDAFRKKTTGNNIEFIGSVDLPELNKFINDADVCLGVFGDTIKSRMVIPNKVYEALACKKPIVTQESEAVKELLVDRESVLLCRGGDPQSLAEKILLFKNDAELREKIATNGYDIFIRELQPSKLVQKFL